MHNPLTIIRNTLARHLAKPNTTAQARAALRDADLFCRKADEAEKVYRGDDEMRYRLAALQLIDRARGYAVRSGSSPWCGFEHLRALVE